MQHEDTFPWTYSYTGSSFCTDIEKKMFKIIFVFTRKIILAMIQVEGLHRLKTP